MAVCFLMIDPDRRAECQRQNRKAQDERRDDRLDRIEARQGGRTERTETRQGGRSDRVETRVKGGATLGQGLQGLGEAAGALLAPSGTVAPSGGAISSTTVLLGGAALAAVLLLTSK